MSRRNKPKGARQDKLVFRIITPRNFITATELENRMDELLSVEVVDFKTGKKFGTFKLSTADQV